MMENLSPTRAPITPVELLERQISDWRILQTQLDTAGADVTQLAYCEEKITYLETELATLENSAQ